jgi:hypothetical protein
VVVEAAGLAVAFREPACAVPDQAASAPRITEPPARKLSVVARRCVKRTGTNLSTLLVMVTADLYCDSEPTGRRMGISTHIRSPPYLCVSEYADRGERPERVERSDR